MLGKGERCAQELTWNIQSSSLELQLPHRGDCEGRGCVTVTALGTPGVPVLSSPSKAGQQWLMGFTCLPCAAHLEHQPGWNIVSPTAPAPSSVPVCSLLPSFLLLLAAQPSPSAPVCPHSPGCWQSPAPSGAELAQPAQRAPATLQDRDSPGAGAFHRHIPAFISWEIIPGHCRRANPALPALSALERRLLAPGSFHGAKRREPDLGQAWFPPGCACPLSIHLSIHPSLPLELLFHSSII